MVSAVAQIGSKTPVLHSQTSPVSKGTQEVLRPCYFHFAGLKKNPFPFTSSSQSAQLFKWPSQTSPGVGRRISVVAMAADGMCKTKASLSVSLTLCSLYMYVNWNVAKYIPRAPLTTTSSMSNSVILAITYICVPVLTNDSV